MRRMLVGHLRPGMVLARSIYDNKGRVLLSAGKELKSSYLERLAALGISCVYVVDSRLDDVEIMDILTIQTRVQAHETLHRVYQDAQRGATLDMESVTRVVSNILDDILQHKALLSNLLDIQFFDDYTFSHSINVCVLSLVTAMGMNYCHNKLRDIGVGAILHDIGKLFVPQEILNKPGHLNDQEMFAVRKHTDSGFEVLRDYPDISLLSAHVAYQHHERCDGSGYPRGLSGEDIHPYARLVAVADVYDALTANRVYRPAYLPHQAVELVISEAGTKFHADVVRSFLKQVPVYPVATMVKLSDGRVGAVVDANKGYVGRPRVRILYAADGRLLKEPYEVDLSHEPTLFVSEVISDDSYFVN